MTPSPPASGIRATSLSVLTLVLSGCLYTFQAGAGFPDDVKTVAIVPFENDTNRPEITDELFQALLKDFPRSQGLQPAGEEFADAVVTGKITRYSVSASSYRPGAEVEVLERQVMLSVEVQIIDLIRNEVLWENRSVSVQGPFLEGSQTEDEGRALAIKDLVQRIIDGAQSNW